MNKKELNHEKTLALLKEIDRDYLNKVFNIGEEAYIDDPIEVLAFRAREEVKKNYPRMQYIFEELQEMINGPGTLVPLWLDVALYYTPIEILVGCLWVAEGAEE